MFFYSGGGEPGQFRLRVRSEPFEGTDAALVRKSGPQSSLGKDFGQTLHDRSECPFRIDLIGVLVFVHQKLGNPVGRKNKVHGLPVGHFRKPFKNCVCQGFDIWRIFRVRGYSENGEVRILDFEEGGRFPERRSGRRPRTLGVEGET